MTAPSESPGLWIPFANPIEIFPVSADGGIDYARSYRAVCHQLTAQGLGILQVESSAPPRLVIGVHCEGRVFFLPGHRLDFGQALAGVYELWVRFTTAFDPQGKPPKITFVADANVKPWLQEMQERQLPGEEKRRTERFVYNETITMSGVTSEQAVFSLNLSAGGIALITTFPLEPGEVRVLKLPQPDGSERTVKTRIVRCTPILPRFYNVGGQFLEE